MKKALSSPADVLCFDLEDSVSPDRKAEAREMVRGAAYTCVRLSVPIVWIDQSINLEPCVPSLPYHLYMINHPFPISPFPFPMHPGQALPGDRGRGRAVPQRARQPAGLHVVDGGHCHDGADQGEWVCFFF